MCYVVAEALLCPSVHQCTVLTDRLVCFGGEVLSADGCAGATSGCWRRLTELYRIAHFIIPVYSFPLITATQRKKIIK